MQATPTFPNNDVDRVSFNEGAVEVAEYTNTPIGNNRRENDTSLVNFLHKKDTKVNCPYSKRISFSTGENRRLKGRKGWHQ